MSNLIQAIRMESPDTIPVSLGVLPAVWLSSLCSVTAGLLAARLLEKRWRS